jgi:uncharacterized protein (TIGR02145 family)
VPSSSSVQVVQSGVIYGTPVTYEGETYQTVVIGTQTWMARNLNYNASGSKCYDDDPTNCTTYGRLYDWATAMALSPDCNTSTCASEVSAKHKGICPTGWHIPSNTDWNVLIKFVDPSCPDNTVNSNCIKADRLLKATSNWNSGGNGTDAYGFSALPGGTGSSYGGFGNVGDFGYWWSTTEYSDGGAYVRNIYYKNDVISGNISVSKDYTLLSVRCVRD